MVGKVLLQERRAQVRGVEQHVVDAVRFISKSIARATMSRGASSSRSSCAAMKRVPSRQLQLRALAAQRLGDQEAALLRVVQAGRVELDELHVADAAAGAPRHRDAVAGGGVGVARVAVDLADAAGGQHDGERRQRLDALPVDVHRVDAVAARRLLALQVARGDQIDRHPALAQRDVRMRARLARAARRGWPCRSRRRHARCGAPRARPRA